MNLLRALALALLCALAAGLLPRADACGKGTLKAEDFDGCVQFSEVPYYVLHYRARNGTLTIGLEVESSMGQWVGWGLSESGSMRGADVVILKGEGCAGLGPHREPVAAGALHARARDVASGAQASLSAHDAPRDPPLPSPTPHTYSLSSGEVLAAPATPIKVPALR